MEEEKQGKHWYVIHTYSGYENKVRANLERKVHSLGMENEIFRIEIPTEKEVEITSDGKKKVVEHKVCLLYTSFCQRQIQLQTFAQTILALPGSLYGSFKAAVALIAYTVSNTMLRPVSYTHLITSVFKNNANKFMKSC